MRTSTNPNEGPVSEARARPRLRPADVRLDMGGVTVRGQQRVKNDDQFFIATLEPSLSVVKTSVSELREVGGSRQSTSAVLAVCDGIGGEGSGDRASAAAIQAVASCLRSDEARHDHPTDMPSIPGVRSSLERMFALAHAGIERLVRDGAGPPRMGTTLTLAYIHLPQLYIAHIGDSRCYLLREGTLFQLTRDHTVAEELRRAWGQKIEDDAPLSRILNRALGGGSNTDHRPDITRWGIMLGDVVLLCSDGITRVLDDSAIARVLTDEDSGQSAANELALMARAAGGGDDITAVVARIVPPKG
ncbi:MAG TPA: protein phosphatase 2C domain-containing protein [Polyangiaceae bacterium]|jgi:PPM family protein phosphatase|nr:protein phosphatase 2C domain-containing protein [Polyangiaceae bacterium]